MVSFTAILREAYLYLTLKILRKIEKEPKAKFSEEFNLLLTSESMGSFATLRYSQRKHLLPQGSFCWMIDFLICLGATPSQK